MFVPRYTLHQWAEARRLRGEGLTYAAIAGRLGFASATTISRRAREEAWSRDPPSAGGERTPPAKRRVQRRPSPDTHDIRRNLARRLYRLLELKIIQMEMRMNKELQAQAEATDGASPPPARDERETFTALIESINQVTEMASEPALAADGRRKSANLNPELTALSDDLDADALAAASEKDDLRREIADKLDKLVPKA